MIWQQMDRKHFNSFPPGQNGSHFADDIFMCIFMNEKSRILSQISLKFVPKGPIDNKVSIGSGNGLAPNRRQAIIWTNADPVQRRIYAALGGDELIVIYKWDPITIFLSNSFMAQMFYVAAISWAPVRYSSNWHWTFG